MGNFSGGKGLAFLRRGNTPSRKKGKHCLHLDVKTTIPISLTNTIYIETHMKTRFCKHKLYSMFCIVNIAIFSLSLFLKYLLFCITNSVLSIGHNSSL